MSNTAKLSISASIDAVLCLMFYLWQIEGLAPAGRVFMFWVWLVGILGLLVIFATPEAKDYQRERALPKIVSYGSSAAVVVATVWTGHEVAAAIYVVAVLVSYVHERQARRLAEAAK